MSVKTASRIFDFETNIQLIFKILQERNGVHLPILLIENLFQNFFTFANQLNTNSNLESARLKKALSLKINTWQQPNLSAANVNGTSTFI